jgi:hypothetical protein
VHEIEGFIKTPSARMEVGPGHGEVLPAASGPDSQHETPSGNLIKSRGLLGQQNWIPRGGAS